MNAMPACGFPPPRTRSTLSLSGPGGIDEVAKYKTIFAHYDENSDRNMERDELAKLLTELGAQTTLFQLDVKPSSPLHRPPAPAAGFTANIPPNIACIPAYVHGMGCAPPPPEFE